MRMTKRILSLTLILMMLTALCVPVLATDIKKEYDGGASNTLDITMTAGGGSLKIYKVASRTGGTSIAGENGFDKCSDLPKNMNDVAADAVALAAKLLKFAEDKAGSSDAPSATTVTVPDSGKVSITVSGGGLYLVASETAAPGYCKITPFLIDLPHFTDGAEWDYNPSAGPKMVAAARLDPPIKKIVTGDSDGKNETFTFTMTPGSKDYPMPDPKSEENKKIYDDFGVSSVSVNTSTGAMTITKKGPGEAEFGWMYYADDEVGKTYTYTIAEKVGSTPGWTYDSVAYTMTVVVSRDSTDGTIKLDITTKDKDGKSVDDMTFTNKYKKDEEKKIPKTGQLWWPVAVMGIGGVVLICVGTVLRRKRDHYDW